MSFVRPHGVIYDATALEFNVTDSLRSIISNYNAAADTFNEQFGVAGISTDTDLFYPSSGHGLLTGETQTIFANTRSNKLRKVNGTTIAPMATGTDPGTGPGELYYPDSSSSFTDGTTFDYVLVSNTLNNRVEVFDGADISLLVFENNFGSP